MPGSSLEAEGEGYVIGSRGPVVILVWTGAASVEGLAAYERILEATSHMYHQIGSLVVIEETTGPRPPPSNDVRSAIVDLYLRLGHQIVGVPLVFEGQGWQAGLVRGVCSGVAMAVRGMFPTLVFQDCGTAAAWLCERLGDQLSPAALVGELTRLRSRAVAA